MLCETCRWSGRPDFVRAARNVQKDDGCEMIPRSDCGGQAIAQCCDGICEQPDVERFAGFAIQSLIAWAESWAASFDQKHRIAIID